MSTCYVLGYLLLLMTALTMRNSEEEDEIKGT
jgi:hypothetical protein